VLRVFEIEPVLDALQPDIHLGLRSLAPQIIASHAVNVFTHSDELGNHVRQRCLHFRLSGLELFQDIVQQFVGDFSGMPGPQGWIPTKCTGIIPFRKVKTPVRHDPGKALAKTPKQP
jgi:hypothetical protein